MSNENMDTNPGSPTKPFAEPSGYVPEIWSVEKGTIYAAINALENAMGDTIELLAEHDRALGRTTRKNEHWAEMLERQIEHARETLAKLKACGPAHNDKISGRAPQKGEHE